MDVRGYARLHSQGGRREYRDPHETNPNPNRVSTLAASPAPPTPAHGATCHPPESASPTRSGRCHQTPPASPLPASPAALISCPSTAACPTSLGCGPSSSMLRFRQQLAGGPGVPAARGARYPPPRRPSLSPGPPESRQAQPRPRGAPRSLASTA